MLKINNSNTTPKRVNAMRLQRKVL